MPTTQYDLQKRTTDFAKKIILFCKKIPNSPTSQPLIIQLIKSGTSVGANYREAIGAVSKDDFRNKIFICKKEAQETQYWLELMPSLHPPSRDDAVLLFNECREYVKIFQKTGSTLNHQRIRASK